MKAKEFLELLVNGTRQKNMKEYKYLGGFYGIMLVFGIITIVLSLNLGVLLFTKMIFTILGIILIAMSGYYGMQLYKEYAANEHFMREDVLLSYDHLKTPYLKVLRVSSVDVLVGVKFNKKQERYILNFDKLGLDKTAFEKIAPDDTIQIAGAVKSNIRLLKRNQYFMDNPLKLDIIKLAD